MFRPAACGPARKSASPPITFPHVASLQTAYDFSILRAMFRPEACGPARKSASPPITFPHVASLQTAYDFSILRAMFRPAACGSARKSASPPITFPHVASLQTAFDFSIIRAIFRPEGGPARKSASPPITFPHVASLQTAFDFSINERLRPDGGRKPAVHPNKRKPRLLPSQLAKTGQSWEPWCWGPRLYRWCSTGKSACATLIDASGKLTIISQGEGQR